MCEGKCVDEVWKKSVGGRCVQGSVWMRCGRRVWGKVCDGKCVDEVWEESVGKVWEEMTGECE